MTLVKNGITQNVLTLILICMLSWTPWIGFVRNVCKCIIETVVIIKHTSLLLSNIMVVMETLT